MRKRVSAFLIREGHIVKDDFAFNRRQFLRVGMIGDRFRKIHNRENAIRPRHRFLNRAVNAADPFDRVCQIDGVRKKRHQRSGGDHAVDDLVAAEPDDDRHGERRQKLYRRRQETHELIILHFSAKIQLVLPVKALDLKILPTEGLHDPHGGDAFLHGRRDIRQPFLNDGAGRFQLAPENLHRLPDEGYGDQCQEAELPVQQHHHDKRADEN